MKISSLDNVIVKNPEVRLARLSGSHGYRFDGDVVHLNAMFGLLDPAAHEHSWGLQLWACPSAPAAAADIAGHLVAEVQLPPMSELADETEHFEVTAFARTPAGSSEYAMVLVLASRSAGHFSDVHDFAVYPRREVFVQPRLGGEIGYHIEGGRVQISAESVENPRVADNRSGTLSLELWALPVPFDGGLFQGHQLAGVDIGTLAGQTGLAPQLIDLAFAPPPAGNWHIVLMLREWTAEGFITRDFTPFAVPFISALVLKEPVVGSAETSGQVSVNNAGVEELVLVKGISRKLAEGIVKKRPFASLEDLRTVKGLGAKILAKIRAGLKL